VAVHEFLFAIELSGPLPSRDMLTDLASRVFGHVGCAGVDLAALVDELQSAISGSAPGGDVSCDVRFRAHAGMLHIDVTSGSGYTWHASRSIACHE
jgi:hypothetical protein